jgi:hypothetical protein
VYQFAQRVVMFSSGSFYQKIGAAFHARRSKLS